MKAYIVKHTRTAVGKAPKEFLVQRPDELAAETIVMMNECLILIKPY
jgi:hypothetical protein